MITMKNAMLLLVCLFGSTLLFAQNKNLSNLAIIQQDGNWIKILPDARVTPDDFFSRFIHDLGLDENYHFELVGQSKDDLGYTHYRYNEHFKGKPIEGATFILHEIDGLLISANGNLIRGIIASDEESITAEDALEKAKEYMASTLFYWEIPEMETLIKRIKNDPNATFYPKAELVYGQDKFATEGSEYLLSWKYEIYAADPEEKKTVFVDASSGEILFALEGLHDGAVEGIAETRYHGTRSIITDSISPSEYILLDTTRGNGIETYDLNESEDVSDAVDFVDEDNYWDNANAELDDAATDAHWGAEMTYDYFLEEHGRNSFDDQGSAIISYIHSGENWNNAFNNSLWSQFGDGNENPLTSVDIVAHEIAHAVCGTSAGLMYQDESGALNESFSDIWGEAVESFALGQDPDWLSGKENFISRDLSNPNFYNDPDTYQGNFWATGTQDNGGVHTNSGVQNYWFYLLSVGGSGTNDNGDVYNVDSLGMNVATAIAYRNLTTYLTENSNYLDARIGAIQAAEDLYGTCSYEVLQVTKAWYAVGVGPETILPDFQMVQVLSPLLSTCDLGSNEEISMDIRFNPSGCGLSLEANDEIVVSYQINSEDPIVETITLSETLNEGEIISYQFDTPADLAIPDQYLLDFTVTYSGDSIFSNNAIINHELTNPHIMEGSNVLSFEHFNAADSLFVVFGNNSEGGIKTNAANTGVKGYRMNSFGATLQNATIVFTDAQNYSSNPQFVSKMCTCTDLTGWNEAYLNFDLRQTYSPGYESEFGIDLSYMIGMRVTVDGLQIGDQFHPETNNSDPYTTRIMDLSDYAGTSFTLCFEGIHFANDEEVSGFYPNGDKSDLDNVFFSESVQVNIEEIQSTNIVIYPNPSSGYFTLTMENAETYDLEVIDLLGHVVKVEQIISNGNPVVLDLTGLAKGNYVLSIRSENSHVVQKILLE